MKSIHNLINKTLFILRFLPLVVDFKCYRVTISLRFSQKMVISIRRRYPSDNILSFFFIAGFPGWLRIWSRRLTTSISLSIECWVVLISFAVLIVKVVFPIHRLKHKEYRGWRLWVLNWWGYPCSLVCSLVSRGSPSLSNSSVDFFLLIFYLSPRHLKLLELYLQLRFWSLSCSFPTYSEADFKAEIISSYFI